MLCSEPTVEPSAPLLANASKCEPGLSPWGKITNCPAASALTEPMTLPPSIKSTFEFGAARPATRVAPSGSTRAMSKLGFAGGATTAAAAGFSAGAVGKSGAAGFAVSSAAPSLLGLDVFTISAFIGPVAVVASGKAVLEGTCETRQALYPMSATAAMPAKDAKRAPCDICDIAALNSDHMFYTPDVAVLICTISRHLTKRIFAVLDQ